MRAPCDVPTPSAHGYIDRESGRLVEEKIVHSGLFSRLYSTPTGRAVRAALFHSEALHRAVAWIADSTVSRPLIARLIDAARPRVEEAELPLHEYATLNQFFARRLAREARPLHPDPSALVCPGDGKLMVHRRISEDATFVIKGIALRLEDLLVDATLGRRFAAGSALVLRLYLGDYHRFHFPAAGVAASPRRIGGHYYSVTPFPGNDVDFYCRNQRVVTLIDTEYIGALCIVAIGGFLISTIRMTYEPGAVNRGEEIGHFAFGGSTLALFMEPGRVELDDDLVANSERGLETYCKLGTRIGRAAAT